MPESEFLALQYGLVYAFGPVVAWWLVILTASGIFSSVLIVWLAMLRRLSSRR